VNTSAAERDLEILEHIHASERVRQRDLAHVVGLSLGMTNAILKRLAQTGLIVVRKVNNRNIRYAVSPAGLEAIARRSYRYLRRTIRNVVDYRRTLEGLVAAVRKAGYRRIELVGRSDLDFILEHACARMGVEFAVRGRRTDGQGPDPQTFVLLSERRTRSRPSSPRESGRAYLGELLLSGPAGAVAARAFAGRSK
jgi:DNA-binding MarR family transcriptional regulator